MIEVVNVWKNNATILVEVKELPDDFSIPPVPIKAIIVWDAKTGDKAPSKEEAIALFNE
jgi:hypothetical protein